MNTNLQYSEGYFAGIMHFRDFLKGAQMDFKADRKRNNVANIIWLLDCVLENIDIFAQYGKDTPIHFECINGNNKNKKKYRYYVKRDEYPCTMQRPMKRES